MNQIGQMGISLGEAIIDVAAVMRQITVKVSGSKRSQGSGTVWRPGLIVTNAHVADLHVHEIEFATGVRVPRWVVAQDRGLDLEALAVSSPFGLTADIRSATELRAGEMVLPLGNPIDGPESITAGIVHCPVGNSPRLFADINLAPSYSGGPLAETSGAVVGINSMIVGTLGGAITNGAVEEFLSRFHLSEAA